MRCAPETELCSMRSFSVHHLCVTCYPAVSHSLRKAKSVYGRNAEQLARKQLIDASFFFSRSHLFPVNESLYVHHTLRTLTTSHMVPQQQFGQFYEYIYTRLLLSSSLSLTPTLPHTATLAFAAFLFTKSAYMFFYIFRLITS